MIKIEIYPFKDDCVKTLYDEKHPDYNPRVLCEDDVDFDLQPEITILLGWVMGKSVDFIKKGEYLPYYFSGSSIMWDYELTEWYEPFDTPCLKAVVELNGEIQQIEHYRVKILKEE